VRNGQLYGAAIDDRTHQDQSVQEGRLGYEQYSSKALLGLGFDQHVAATYHNGHARQVMIDGVPVPYDERDFAHLGAHNYVLTEPYALDALEYGTDRASAPLLRSIFEVQKRRWQRTGLATAVSEDNLDRPPYFVYNTIFVDGQPWKAITDTGLDQAPLKTLSVKAAFALSVLFPGEPYARTLRERIRDAREPERGWYSGIFDDPRLGMNKSMTANTNGIILEALLYKVYGPLHRACAACGRGLRFPAEVLRSAAGRSRCLPR
jgi:Protein of unknown function (DUF3131)